MSSADLTSDPPGMSEAPTSAMALTNGLFQMFDMVDRIDDSFLVQSSLGAGI